MRTQGLTGRSFGRWTVISLHDKVRYEYPKGGSCTVLRWLCRCSCGTEKIVRGLLLKNGSSQSCGCYQKDFQRERNTKHGMVGTAEYDAWAHMMDRCRNQKSVEYHNYGGRGITVCERWISAANFLADMGPRPSRKHSLERVRNAEGYSPDNCVWATNSEQTNNTRRNRRLRFNGRVLTISQWAREVGLRPKVIYKRLLLGWTTSDALTIPLSSDKTGWEARRKRKE